MLFVAHLRPETENPVGERYYRLAKNHVLTILTVYCVKAIENNDFKIFYEFMKFFFYPVI